MKQTQTIRAQDPKKIEKELGEFLNKKFGGNVRIISPTAQPQKSSVNGSVPNKGKKELVDFTIKPAELIAYLDQYVVRQAQAKSVLATKICTHFNRIRHQETREDKGSKITGNIKSNILMLGPTGIGKTYLIKLIARKIGVPFVKADATKFSETGYVGGDVEDLIRDLVKEAEDDIELAECGIVYLDEIDKIAASPDVIGAQVSRSGVQRALLKPMEETEVDLKVPHDPVSMMQELERFQRTGKRVVRRVNTANILFILSGAFTGLTDLVRQRLTRQTIGFNSRLSSTDDDTSLLKQTRAEDLVKFGFESEFIGRVPVRCILETLSETDLYTILKMPNNPVILNKRLDFAAYGIDIVFDDDALTVLAHRAFKENTGARGLVSVVEDALLPFEEKLPSCRISRLVVTKQVINDPLGTLKDLLSDTPAYDWESLHKKASETQIQYITQYIQENADTLVATHGLNLSAARCEMAARYFHAHVLEIDDAVSRITTHYDTIKEIERESSRNMGLDIIFEEDAIDFLMLQILDHGASADDILSKLHNAFYDGLNLIKEKTGKHRFFITKTDLQDSEAYLNQLIRKEIK
ncbi:AAA family ATPase [Desulfotignum phosphitoxidans]|uniref:ATP-dependent Clp protease ATP-binding subunit ClpX n=1 Tax=Desulfotignum phosphitoxidans DSM 13687 TaxID=1286635 RepID=S0G3Q0_9BACT|nr:AAA family ATPase [Desulfotignum phosphitoxidans]EMS80109.1 ATP-dependent Clp protease ATP-binding subunit ClpX [Desulfotignum phosphitoxidans DSM 13687]